MNFTHPAHQEMLYAMLDKQVDFILVGGYAVIYHGYVRTTGDMDVWLRPTNENKQRLLDVFRKLDFDPEGIKQISTMDFTSIIVFHVGDQPERIDFLSKISGLQFDDAWKHRDFLQTDHHRIPVLNLDDLLVSKRTSGRLKDKADIEALRKIKNRNP
jgi:hypothetical protein